ncbi:MAG TPA: hypothetical protein VFI44_09310 [Ornithinibacter sp.]|nr:hypothetical protein [Ornithinibacter sp.]
MSSAHPALAHLRPTGPAGAHRAGGDVDRLRTTQRWAVSVLAVATAALLAWLAVLVAASWLAVAALTAVTSGGPVTVDLLAVVGDAAPVLLVGWCTGLATTATLARGEALGARTAGLVSGAVGSVAGGAVLALNGLL